MLKLRSLRGDHEGTQEKVEALMSQGKSQAVYVLAMQPRPWLKISQRAW